MIIRLKKDCMKLQEFMIVQPGSMTENTGRVKYLSETCSESIIEIHTKGERQKK